MHADAFTQSSSGVLLPLEGQVRTRAGIVGYRTVAFRPNRLDECPPLTPRVMGALGRATMALGRLDAIGSDIGDPELIRRPTIRKEAQSTSALEGTYERLETVLAADYEVGGSKQGFNESMAEVLNYLDASDDGIQSMLEGRPLSVHLTRGLQQQLVAGTKSDNGQAGEVRSTQVFIGAPTGRIEDARFVPMPPGQALEAELDALFAWWSARTDPGLAVLDAAMFHYQFETLHPFTDGNGRIGRLLILLQLLNRGVLHQPLLSVSPWFEARRSQYQDCLLAVSERGEWEEWILFFCRAIEDSSNDAIERVRRLKEIQGRYRDQVHAFGATTRDLADMLIAMPYVVGSQIAERMGISRSSAKNAIDNLVQLGILVPDTEFGGRGMRFVAEDVVRIVRA